VLMKKPLPRGVWAVFLLVFVAHAVVAVLVGPWGWDDSYIVVASGSTFVETGHIALTPVSGTVEASTSPVWFLLMSFFYALGFHSPFSLHFIGQLLAALSAGLAAALCYRLLRPSAPSFALPISILTLLLGPFRSESSVAMEMNLLSAAVLGMMVLLHAHGKKQLIALAALSSFIPWVRLEAMGYVLVGACAIWLFSRRRLPALVVLASSVFSTLLLTLVRYIVFGTFFLTNTMLAKSMRPYSPLVGSDLWLIQLVLTIVEPLLVLLPALFVGYGLSLFTGRRMRDTFSSLVASARSRTASPCVVFGISYYLAYAGVEFAAGNNFLNPLGRMGSSALVTLVVSVAILFAGEQRAAPFRRSDRVKIIAVATVILAVPYLGLFGYDTGVFVLNRFFYDPSGDGSDLRYYAAQESMQKNAMAMENMRKMLHKEQLNVLMEDVGIAGACCRKLNILDLALLANRDLTSSGWQGFPEYFSRKMPDIVQTHQLWSFSSGIYKIPAFRENYTPVVFDRSMFYLRNDLFNQVRDKCSEAQEDRRYFWYNLYDTFSPDPHVTTDSMYSIDKDYVENTLHLRTFCRLG
jgi:hypothetical protein